MPKIDDPDFWKSAINSIPQELSSKGSLPPEIEKIVIEEAEQVPALGDMEGHLSKIAFDVYIFLSPQNGKYYMIQNNQRYQDMGETTLGDAIKTIKYKNKKK